MKILLSEGCPIFREGMKFVLENDGYEVDAALSKEHFYKLISTDYDVIIFDLDMLGSMAIDLAKQIDVWMTYSLNKPCRLIATYKEAIAYYMGNLFDGGLRKPFTKEKLLELIDKEFKHDKRFNNQRNLGSNGSFNQHCLV
jgi:DNA-binding NarL/FixJ family response regulator